MNERSATAVEFVRLVATQHAQEVKLHDVTPQYNEEHRNTHDAKSI